MAALPRTPPGIGEAGLKYPTEASQESLGVDTCTPVSCEDSQVSGGRNTEKKCGFASELHIWEDVELSASAGADSEQINFYEMIVCKHTY